MHSLLFKYSGFGRELGSALVSCSWSRHVAATSHLTSMSHGPVQILNCACDLGTCICGILVACLPVTDYEKL